MRAFFIGLQFLTRLSLVKQSEWSAADFGKSVKFFPLIGAVLGFCYALAAYLLLIFLPLHQIELPRHFVAVILLALPILLTGGLHCDGFMDTMDGVFSGRTRERMLEIMKDSCVGSNAVTAFVLYLLMQWALLLDFPPREIVAALFVMPIIARLNMAIGVICYPYARPEGMGKAFADHANSCSLLFAILSALILVLPVGIFAIISMGVSLVFGYWFSRYVTKKLGGLTGDVYGAVSQLTELVVLLVFLATIHII